MAQQGGIEGFIGLAQHKTMASAGVETKPLLATGLGACPFDLVSLD
jgi:hypothetical protein